MSEQTMARIAEQFGIKVSGLKKIRKGIYRVITPAEKRSA